MERDIDKKLSALAKHAATVKSDLTIRHIPNARDIAVASEHAYIIQEAQYQAMPHERNDD